MIIETDAERKAFLDSVAAQDHWNLKPDFMDAMNQADVDFQTEALLLVRYTLGSGTYKVSMEQPALVGDELVIRLAHDNPGSGTKDMAYHCFALAVPKGDWKRVRIVTADIKRDTILTKDYNPPML